jgi:hypothetical protein
MGPGVGGGGEGGNNAKRPASMFSSYFQPEGYTFTVMRAVDVTPTLYKQIDEVLRANPAKPSRMVDLATLLWLIREYTEHRADYPSAPSYTDASEISTTAPYSKGIITRVGGEDGLLDEVTAGPDNVPAWKLATGYIYFDVDNDFTRSLTGPVEVEVTYLDQGTGMFVLQYDAMDFAFKVAGESPAFENSGTWKTARFTLPDPKFSKRQNGGTDMRINTRASQPLVIRGLTIKRLAQ